LKSSPAPGDKTRIIAFVDENVADEATGSSQYRPAATAVGLPSSRPSQENSAQAAPSRDP
jgi:hypothetical protein